MNDEAQGARRQVSSLEASRRSARGQKQHMDISRTVYDAWQSASDARVSEDINVSAMINTMYEAIGIDRCQWGEG